MLTSADRALMQSDADEIRLDNPTTITIRRAEQVTGEVLVMGPAGLDIKPGDRFNDGNGTLYEVTLIRPNRTVKTEAEARVIE